MVRRVACGVPVVALLCLLFVADALIARTAADLPGPLGDLLRRGSILPLVSVAVFLLGAVEMNHLLRLQGTHPHSRFAYLTVAVLVLAPWLSSAGWLGSGPRLTDGIFWLASLLVAAGIGVGVLAIFRRDPKGTLGDVGATFLVVVYLGVFGSFAMQIRCSLSTPEQAGVWLLLMVVLVAKVSDIGAYFVGSLLGRHKLIPSISPAKSVEGMLGGFAASAAASVFLVWLGSALAGPPTASPPSDRVLGVLATLEYLGVSSARLPTVRLVFFGFCVSLMSQLGDLFESCFKRDAGVKDSSKVIPPFGGILDVVDSLMFAMPVAWFVLTAAWRLE